MPLTYFPEPLFAWTFLTVLVALLAVAAYFDTRSLRIPKWLTLWTLAAGLVVNVIRGVWLGAAGGEVYVLGEQGAALGGLDGLLFAAAGFLFGFCLFFAMWVLGVCGGGDVKLFAALGTWVGPYLLLGVLVVTLVLVAVLFFGRLFWLLISGQRGKFQKAVRRPAARTTRDKAQLQPKHRLIGFALPVAIACVLVLPWAFRFDLGLAPHHEVPRTSMNSHPN